uniref:Uncharacterized protein n=1 Tax=Oryza glaberrima TaxID=4538 RepID=I1QN95_ORYGL
MAIQSRRALRGRSGLREWQRGGWWPGGHYGRGMQHPSSARQIMKVGWCPLPSACWAGLSCMWWPWCPKMELLVDGDAKALMGLVEDADGGHRVVAGYVGTAADIGLTALGDDLPTLGSCAPPRTPSLVPLPSRGGSHVIHGYSAEYP